MSPGVKKASIIGGATAAVASTGALAYVLTRRGPARAAYRESIGWRSAKAAYARPRESGKVHASSSAPASGQPSPRAAPMKSADPKPTPGLFGALKEIVYEFLNDDVMTQAAALAFYTGLAMAPLLTVVVWTARVFLPSGKKFDVMNAFKDVMGPQAAKPIETLLNPASQQAPTSLTVAGLVSIALVAFSASGVFGQVQSALNAIWHVQAKPSNGVIGFVRKRVLSLGMLASILFLLMASLVVSVALQGLLSHTGGPASVVGVAVNNLVSIGLFTLLFAALFKFVPDAKIGWRPVWIGSAMSAVLFTLGKFGLGFYLAKSNYDSSYQAFGSFVALLVWVYYSAVIVLVGAEATEVTARRLGHALEPDTHAVRVIQTTEPA